LDGDGLSVYGTMTIEQYTEDTDIAAAIVNSLSSNLLSANFDLKQAKYAGFIVAANKDVWAKIPASSINYANSMLNDTCASPRGIFRGIYTVDIPEDVVKVYSFFSGLGLPMERVDELKKEAATLQTKSGEKDDRRNLTLSLNTGVSDTVSQAQKLKEKIKDRASALGKLQNNTIVDRRK
jgi:hypothetical protein